MNNFKTAIVFLVAAVIPSCERQRDEFPSSVVYRMIGSNRHLYVISGIYENSAKAYESEANRARRFFPYALNLDFSFGEGTCTLITRKRLANSELIQGINYLAAHSTAIPYWSELKARDLHKSPLFNEQLYLVKRVETINRRDLNWIFVSTFDFDLTRDSTNPVPTSTTLKLDGGVFGTLLIVPSTGFCMCHSRFVIRILNEKGQLLWKDDSIAFGDVKVAIGSRKDEHMPDDIFVRRDVHGNVATFLIHINQLGQVGE